MRKVLKRLALLGVLAGAAIAVRGYLKRGGVGEEVVQITFDDNTTLSLASDSIEGQEFTEIARKLVEIGV